MEERYRQEESQKRDKWRTGATRISWGDGGEYKQILRAPILQCVICVYIYIQCV